ncbi:phospholipase D family protein [Escherichia coli]|uniref:phospholipase D family protein n=2 Tax=Escherichia coli TaxID=562 RepID=UPI000BE5DD8A|nr:phospholipase D family protein [Escherichia coli]
MKILNTTGINFHLEHLIKTSVSEVYLISPYLKISSNLRELIEYKANSGVKFHIVFGKKDLNKDISVWISELPHVHLMFCQNLHAKCYMNETMSIISSLNLYDFSQINNLELGVLLNRDDDYDCFNDCKSEVERILRSSSEKIIDTSPKKNQKLTISGLSQKYNLEQKEVYARLLDYGYITKGSTGFLLTPAGQRTGGEFKPDKFRKGEYYFLFPADILDKKRGFFNILLGK